MSGLNSFKPDERPKQVNAIFQVYHVMIVIGVILILLTLSPLVFFGGGENYLIRDG